MILSSSKSDRDYKGSVTCKKGEEVMKTKFLTAALVGASALTIATTAIADTRDFGNAYVGAQIGWKSMKNKFNSVTRAGVSTTTDLGGDGFTAGLQVGYGFQFENAFYFALDGSINFGNTKGNVGAERVELKETFGIDAIFGYAYENVLPFFSLGWSNANHKFWDEDDAAGNKKSGTKRSNGFVVGLGMSTLLTENVVLTPHWKYHIYNRSSIGNNKVEPRVSDFAVKLSYKW